MLTGGCSCGKLRYQAHGTPFHSTVCHCADCRRVAGAPMVAWFSVAAGDLRFVAGEPGRYASSPKVVRQFCPACGTPLTYQHQDASGEIDVATCTLDDPEALPPQDHTYAGRRLSWVHLADGLRRFPTTRSGP